METSNKIMKINQNDNKIIYKRVKTNVFLKKVTPRSQFSEPLFPTKVIWIRPLCKHFEAVENGRQMGDFFEPLCIMGRCQLTSLTEDTG